MRHNDLPITIKKAFSEEQRYNNEDYYVYVDGYSRDDINTKEFIESAKYFHYDKKYFVRVNNDEVFDDCVLEFYGKEILNYHDLFYFINGYLSNSNKIFIQEYNGIIIKDFRYNIFDTTHLYLYKCVIDKDFINIINKYFKKLEYLSIENCIIEDNAYFYNLDSDISIKNSTIKNSRSLKNVKSNLEYKDNTIVEYENIKIESLKISFTIEDNEFEELLEKTMFPKLYELNITSNTIDESLKYLPSSCPNVVDLEINSLISSFEFLYRMNNLASCRINSVDDSVGTLKLLTPEITNTKERKRIISSKKEEYQERLDLLEHLNRSLTVKKILRFSREEKEMHLGINSNSKQSYIYVYDSKNNNMNLKYDSNSYEKVMFNDRLYLISKSNIPSSALIKKKKEILLSPTYIYYRNDIIILFKQSETKTDIINQVEKEKRYIKYM